MHKWLGSTYDGSSAGTRKKRDRRKSIVAIIEESV